MPVPASSRPRPASCLALAASPSRSRRTAGQQERSPFLAASARELASTACRAIGDDRRLVRSCSYLNINHFLSRECHEPIGTVFALHPVWGCDGAAEKDMKIYLLMMLIGTLLTAIHFTSAQERRSKSLQR